MSFLKESRWDTKEISLKKDGGTWVFILLTHPKLLSLEYARMDSAFFIKSVFWRTQIKGDDVEVKWFFLDKKEFVCKSAEDGGWG